MNAYFHLLAYNLERNIDRFYTITLAPTLFNDYSLILYHGRRGHKGRTHLYTFQAVPELIKKLKATLHRRFYAKARLGVNYTPVDIKYDASFQDNILPHLTALQKLG